MVMSCLLMAWWAEALSLIYVYWIKSLIACRYGHAQIGSHTCTQTKACKQARASTQQRTETQTAMWSKNSAHCLYWSEGGLLTEKESHEFLLFTFSFVVYETGLREKVSHIWYNVLECSPVPVAARSKALVYDRSPAAIIGSNIPAPSNATGKYLDIL
jgi:hypothetical protein